MSYGCAQQDDTRLGGLPQVFAATEGVNDDGLRGGTRLEQFEITVGELDPDMRVALSIERELGQVMRTATTNDARWFSIMSSPPLRQAFEGAFRLPSSFGSIDIDQQLLVLKDRATKFFGTSEVSGFLEPERLGELRQSYLLTRSIEAIGTTSAASAASIVLANL